ncbi:MotA/TolQ/ExbB proton channel family protein [Candidatus Desantisbacteria bacterium CG_4_9_14_3_um_filter_40_11]|uniref:MotA/TolQ/ExbB proton channel family protein n=3 Tax=unclassified Candidatus Desantisiibacteriota TaxID=3106372 RepID=A0A2M7J851_9BACT|nr:MAG: MotA/TolQ/ExbB proton channel family protein [Candidatus Desantisbacteria bacterium CG_4_8_14_3_um_filter_40_12]PIY19331.1 MAG: MotA/TolQ/ExbB proton channel family protein [Candidatus Desantisbacteria bacterium CG_4_10_14_3_um_filter_40_18]PJB29098.1 MAG: MotA/TolQ/ExbB proton channel family protein [Candidatus Desantisbacteria bacterium CG_4_9_14_3_um_filter_40_11]
MLEFILKGGMMMYPIILCSIAAIAIILNRAYHFFRIRIDVSQFLSQIEQALQSNKIDIALKHAKNTRGPLSTIVEAGISNSQKDIAKWEKAISRVGTKELLKLEKNLRSLGIIAHISPLLGLLGTVTGMIKAFMKIQELGGKVDASVLAGGIWEALLTTAAGLFVAIPTMVAYHYFEGKVDNYATLMKESATLVSEWLEIGKLKQEKKTTLNIQGRI